MLREYSLPTMCRMSHVTCLMSCVMFFLHKKNLLLLDKVVKLVHLIFVNKITLSLLCHKIIYVCKLCDFNNLAHLAILSQ